MKSLFLLLLQLLSSAMTSGTSSSSSGSANNNNNNNGNPSSKNRLSIDLLNPIDERRLTNIIDWNNNNNNPTDNNNNKNNKATSNKLSRQVAVEWNKKSLSSSSSGESIEVTQQSPTSSRFNYNYRAADNRGSAEFQLYQKLVGPNSNYLKHIRPVVNSSEAIFVEVGMSVNMVEELVERDQTMIMVATVKMKWKDAFLSWDPQKYNNLTLVAIPTDLIWLPDITVVNSPEAAILTHKTTHVQVDSHGEMGYFPSGRLMTRCNLHILFFPFDKQHCEVLLESWIYPNDLLLIRPYMSIGNTVDIRETYTNHQWAINGHRIQMGATVYDGYNFSSIAFIFLLQRKSDYYFMYYVFPQLLLACLQTLSHTLPVEHPGRMTLLTSLFIGTSVTQAAVAVHIPKSSVLSLLVTFFMMYAVLRIPSMHPNLQPSIATMVLGFLSVEWSEPLAASANHHPPPPIQHGHHQPNMSVANVDEKHPAAVAKKKMHNGGGHLNNLPSSSSLLMVTNNKSSEPAALLPSNIVDEHASSRPPTRHNHHHLHYRVRWTPSTSDGHLNDKAATSKRFDEEQQADMFDGDDEAMHSRQQDRYAKLVISQTDTRLPACSSTQHCFQCKGNNNTLGHVAINSSNDDDDEFDIIKWGSGLQLAPSFKNLRSSLLHKSLLKNSSPDLRQPQQDERYYHHDDDEQCPPHYNTHSRKASSAGGGGGGNNQRKASNGAITSVDSLSQPTNGKNKQQQQQQANQRRRSSTSLLPGGGNQQKTEQQITRDMKRRWLIYCVALDKTIMYVQAVWHAVIPLLLFVVVPFYAPDPLPHVHVGHED